MLLQTAPNMFALHSPSRLWMGKATAKQYGIQHGKVNSLASFTIIVLL